MAFEILIGMIGAEDRKAKSIIDIKPGPDPAWGASECPPNFGIITVTERQYADFEWVDEVWYRDVTLTRHDIDSWNATFRVREITPGLNTKVDALGLSDIDETLTGCATRSGSWIDDDGSFNFKLSALGGMSLAELENRLQMLFHEKVDRRRYQITDETFNQLQGGDGYLTISDIVVVDTATGELLDGR